MTTTTRLAAYRAELLELDGGPTAIPCPRCASAPHVACMSRDHRLHAERTDAWALRRFELNRLLAWETGQ